MKKIIGISGRAGAGKDTVADYLIAEGIIDGKFSIAGSLKRICGELFNIAPIDMLTRKEGDSGVVITTDIAKLLPDLWGEVGREFTIREILQYFGTDIVRKFNANAWINAALREVENAPGNFYAIPDVRFLNEVEAIKKAGGTIIRLTRNPFNMTHCTEIQLDDYSGFDLVYDNAGEDVDTTLTNITQIIKEYYEQ